MAALIFQFMPGLTFGAISLHQSSILWELWRIEKCPYLSPNHNTHASSKFLDATLVWHPYPFNGKRMGMEMEDQGYGRRGRNRSLRLQLCLVLFFHFILLCQVYNFSISRSYLMPTDLHRGKRKH